MSLLVSGTVALDNVKTPSGTRQKMLGGSASHFCMSASLFAPVHLSAVVGENFPPEHIRLLKKKGVNTASLQQKSGSTFEWDGEYEARDPNQALTRKTELGVLADFSPKLGDAQRSASHVFLANDDPVIQEKVLDQVLRPKLVGLDSMNLWITHKRDLLLKLMRRVDLFVANDGEARMLTGEGNLIKAAKALRALGPALVVVKKGEHGALFESAKCRFCFPAYPVETVVDPTGAGDTFAGGLMGYLASAKNMSERTLKGAVVYASVLASFNVEGFGVERTARLTLTDVNKRKKAFLKFIS